MRRRVTRANGGFSELFKELARRIAEADGVVPLKPGQLRPRGYYMAGFWTMGRKPIDISDLVAPPQPPRDKR
jgi:hypothetical protein